MTTVSELTGSGQGRKRRSDARRSAAAVLDAAVAVLGQRPEASVEEIAAAAGVTRQTVYAHHPSRQALREAVIDRITEEFLAAVAAARLEEDTATEALVRWLDTAWRVMERYPLLLHPSAAEGASDRSLERHLPVLDQLRRLVRRGQHAGEFDPDQPIDWLLAATVALGHAAGEEVAAGRMSARQAAEQLRTSVLRLYRH